MSELLALRRTTSFVATFDAIAQSRGQRTAPSPKSIVFRESCLLSSGFRSEETGHILRVTIQGDEQLSEYFALSDGTKWIEIFSGSFQILLIEVATEVAYHRLAALFERVKTQSHVQCIQRYQAKTSTHDLPSLSSSLTSFRSSPYQISTTWPYWTNSGLAKSWKTRNGESGWNPGSAYHMVCGLFEMNFSRGNKIRLGGVVMNVPRVFGCFVEQPHLLANECLVWRVSQFTSPLVCTILKAARNPSHLMVNLAGLLSLVPKQGSVAFRIVHRPEIKR